LINYSKEMLVYSTIHMDSYGKIRKEWKIHFISFPWLSAKTNHSKILKIVKSSKT